MSFGGEADRSLPKDSAGVSPPLKRKAEINCTKVCRVCAPMEVGGEAGASSSGAEGEAGDNRQMSDKGYSLALLK